MKWYLKSVSRYVGFIGRASRLEYWMFVLYDIILWLISVVTDNSLNLTFGDLPFGYISVFYFLATLVPRVSVLVRRLHDSGRSGFMMFISLIPLVGWVWLLALTLADGNRCGNRYGDDPRQTQHDEFAISKSSGDSVIVFIVMWMFFTKVFWQFISPVISESYGVVLNTLVAIIWEFIPVALSFAIKDKPKQMLISIVAGCYFLFGLYSIAQTFS
ncbi:MAG: DUF805 domain-containing protein [Bacteroidales bacterium]|jgi:uncharacterized membrane protein YhaH (DUF805 family)|nr:DUF805 domain-containing protein [Bacteroidales bacterium]